jgi:hypothetical protein
VCAPCHHLWTTVEIATLLHLEDDEIRRQNALVSASENVPFFLPGNRMGCRWHKGIDWSGGYVTPYFSHLLRSNKHERHSSLGDTY